MSITLFELAGADPEVRFSPHCWKSRLALVHKELAYHGEPVRFTEKEKIAFSNQPLLPVLKDNDSIVNDSWDIAVYLEEHYPQTPHLFIGEKGKVDAKAFNEWVDSEIAQYIRPAIIMPVYHVITPSDQEYFRTTREKKLGKKLEDIETIAPEKLTLLTAALEPVRESLQVKQYLGGDQPDYKDICLLSVFLWMATITNIQFLEPTDRVYTWYQDMLEYFAATLPDTVRATT